MGGKEPAEMTVAVLREELKRRGLDTTGLKAVLVERLRGAIDALGEITGMVSTDDILDRIFRDFCIGK